MLFGFNLIAFAYELIFFVNRSLLLGFSATTIFFLLPRPAEKRIFWNIFWTDGRRRKIVWLLPAAGHCEPFRTVSLSSLFFSFA